MPHLIYEYTDNLDQEYLDIKGLLQKSNRVLMDQAGVFPTGGIRSRAIRLEDYCIADGAENRDAFVHATLKIGAGRSSDIRQKTGDALFEMMKAHFAPINQRRPLALSLEIVEFSETGTWKHNTIHARYKKNT